MKDVLLRLPTLWLLVWVSSVEERSKRSDAQLSAASYHAIWGFGFRVLQKLSIFPRGNGGWSITDESVHHNIKLQA